MTNAHTSTPLPPGQHVIGVFPRYGTHLFRPIPDLSHVDSVAVVGAVSKPADVPITDFATMPRHEMIADFHCVAGWSVRDLRWGGVRFKTLYDTTIAPVAEVGVTHVGFRGIDGFRSVLTLEDALEDDVMVADHLDSHPLGAEHGGPLRLVCPSRYAYKSTKHLCTIELHTAEPFEDHADAVLNTLLKFVKPHPRARVAQEERHRYLPAWSVRWPYFRVLHPAFRLLCVIGDRRSSPQ
jgi:DMSO/TMAO reductase YedYZ molybdopterin-dependent catalytic subunit